jgi:hypothetical protein
LAPKTRAQLVGDPALQQDPLAGHGVAVAGAGQQEGRGGRREVGRQAGDDQAQRRGAQADEVAAAEAAVVPFGAGQQRSEHDPDARCGDEHREGRVAGMQGAAGQQQFTGVHRAERDHRDRRRDDQRRDAGDPQRGPQAVAGQAQQRGRALGGAARRRRGQAEHEDGGEQEARGVDAGNGRSPAGDQQRNRQQRADDVAGLPQRGEQRGGRGLPGGRGQRRQRCQRRGVEQAEARAGQEHEADQRREAGHERDAGEGDGAHDVGDHQARAPGQAIGQRAQQRAEQHDRHGLGHQGDRHGPW